MFKTYSVFLVYIFCMGLSAFGQDSIDNRIDSSEIHKRFNVNERKATDNDSIIISYKKGINNKADFDSIFDFIESKSDRLNEILINDSQRINLEGVDSFFKKNDFFVKDSLLKNIKENLYDSIKVIFTNSFEKLLIYKSKNVSQIDSIKHEEVLKETEFSDQNNTETEGYNKIWIFIVLLSSAIAFILIKKFNRFNKKINLLRSYISELRNKNDELTKKVKYFENEKTQYNTDKKSQEGFDLKSESEIKKARDKVIRALTNYNTLNKSEVEELITEKENRWVTIAHSAIGKNHSKSDPVIPCQDNNHFETLNHEWQLAVVCDGAGSSKMSHFGSELISKTAIPKNLKDELSNLDWFKKGILPSKNEWNDLAIYILKKTYDKLSSSVEQQNKLNGTKYSINDYASTVIIALYNSNGVLVANIGDGRGGYLNKSGEFKALFIPYGGEESNGTIFITSPIWKEPEKFIQTDVIHEEIVSVFLLSDGMEKITFECSNLTDNIFVDANIPYKKFFFPILSKIKMLNNEGELKLIDEWKSFLESGNDAIINEGDDKTLLVSFLK